MSKPGVATAVVAAVLLWGEAVHWRSNRRRLGDRSPATPGGREAVVVLGYRNRSGRANLVNRYRVRAGIRSRSSGQRTTLVLSGGSVGAAVAEAELMARYARDVLHYDGDIVTETQSRTTWENISNVIGLVEDADRIKIVSNALHAEKGRLYLRRLRPDLADRVARSADYRFGELILLKPVMAVIGLRSLRRQLG